LHFATGQFITPNNWNSKQQLVKPPEPDNDIINTQDSSLYVFTRFIFIHRLPSVHIKHVWEMRV
jgi:hypothetical protein